MKLWAHHPAGAISEPLIELPDDLTPGEGGDIFVQFKSADLTDVTARDPRPAQGWITADGGKTFSPAPTSEIDFAALKTQLKARVDAAAEVLRLTLITPGSGQAMEYQEAYAQAQAALAVSGDVEASDYPMLAATIGVDIDPKSGKPATDVLGVARSVKAAYEAFLQVGAAIRGARLLAKAEIDAAPDVDHAQAVFSAVAWPALG